MCMYVVWVCAYAYMCVNMHTYIYNCFLMFKRERLKDKEIELLNKY